MPLSPVLERFGNSVSDTVLSVSNAKPAGRVVSNAPSWAPVTSLLVPLLSACVIALLVMVAINTARAADWVVLLWVANAVAVSIWLRAGSGLGFDLKFGGFITVGMLVGELLAGNPWVASLEFTALNMIEIVIAVVLARRFVPSCSFSSVSSTLKFVLVTAVLAPMPPAAIWAVMMFSVHTESLAMSFQTWCFDHGLGMAAVVPLVLLAKRPVWRAVRNPWRIVEWVGLIGALLAFMVYIYFVSVMPLSFLASPLMVLIAARLRVPGVALAMLGTVILAIAAVTTGHGPASAMAIGERVMLMKLEMLIGYVTFMVVAALLNERDALSQRAEAGQKRAEQASEAKSRLLANVAHEIKSPVAGVIGIGELWSSGQLGVVTPTQTEMADMLVKTARQVETLAHDLLDVARAESGAVKVELRPTNVAGVVEDVRRATILRPEAQSLTIETVCEGDNLVALADSLRLSQVIDNLATNAVKYGSAGGSVIFRVLKIVSGIRVEVIDKGPGLSLVKQAQLFEPFNRLGLERSTIEGHGIGLALARRLVELQNGTVGVVSAPGEGCTFWVELPAA